MSIDLDRQMLKDQLDRGVISHFWVTRNYRVRWWDGTEEFVRLMFPPAPGVAMIPNGEVIEYFVPQCVSDLDKLGDVVTVRRKYMTMSAGEFVDSIVSFC